MSYFRVPDPYAGPVVEGVDVSFYQGHTIDWAKVKASGVGFAIMRTGDGYGRDSCFKDNFMHAKSVGLIVGAYQFMRPDLDEVKQAQMMAGQLHEAGWQRGVDIAPILDVERGNSEGHTADKMISWLNTQQNLLAVRPEIYGGQFIAQNACDPRLTAWPLMTPFYDHAQCMVPKPWQHWTFWQWSSSHNVPGIPGHVDQDRFRGDMAALKAFVAASAV